MNYLSRRPIRSEAFSFLDREGKSGGVVTFVGTPRSASQGRSILHLEYEAYETMAEKAISELVREAFGRWAVWEIELQHRLGPVTVGEPSIVIQARASHRKEAFRAVEFLIDEVKRRVPIWKKEVYQDGASRWVECEL